MLPTSVAHLSPSYRPLQRDYKNDCMQRNQKLEIWGGIECTINRVGNDYFDQLAYSGHYERDNDMDLIASLGVGMVRYPVLWERHQPAEGQPIDWTWIDRRLSALREKGITPIAGLVHHGSGPAHVNFFDGSFETGLADYARAVATRFPWLEYYTPVNEPLTTARFCGLYGHWYPHGKDDKTFFKILLSECKATILAMRAIREINPDAKLIQTEDLGKCHSTQRLSYQAKLENERRWLSYELLCGTLTPNKPMYRYLRKKGITKKELQWFLDNPCRPHIAGFNYYLTSERFLDEDLDNYPEEFHGGNGKHRYADIHTVHVPMHGRACGPATLLKEAWERLGLPMAITECHLHSHREEQIRWFHEMWETCNKLREDGVDVRAITAWALFGLYGWNCLVTKPGGDYEPGVFNLRSGCPRPTALARYLQVLTDHQVYYHPLLEEEGWWKREDSNRYLTTTKVVSLQRRKKVPKCSPLLILGKSGTLGSAFSRICRERRLHHLLVSRADLDLTNKAAVAEAIAELKPWAVVNAAGYVRVDEAEQDQDACFDANTKGPAYLAEACRAGGVKLLTFSSDLVFDGRTSRPYRESDPVAPLNTYGQSKADMEEQVLAIDPSALIVRTSSFFSPWDEFNFVTQTITALRDGREVTAARDVTMAATYVPDLVHTCLDLLLDDEQGIFHIANEGHLSWAALARKVAAAAGFDPSAIKALPQSRMGWKAIRPRFSALDSEKGIGLPSLQDALNRYLDACGESLDIRRMAV
ncbi:MAG: dTDP-4-dehydrorhamnose reductase [Flaviaesturariibacter sp.]|nr:dTDP-4-dehydrorhamnose reductase [Flaviaesturariibacter sp.]